MMDSMDPCKFPIPYSYSKYLYYSSFLIGISSFISFYYEDYKSFLFLFVLFISSIRYWRSPDYGWVRDLDMFICKCVGVYFYMNTLCYYDEYCRAVSIHVLMCMMIFYMIDIILCVMKNEKWIIFHMALHFYISFFTPFVLYIL